MNEKCVDCKKETNRSYDSIYVWNRYNRNIKEGPLCEECYLERRFNGKWVDEDFPLDKIWLDE